MVNKKGWIRIVESVIALLLILGTILALSGNKINSIERDLTPISANILEEIAKNASLREKIIVYDLALGEEQEDNAQTIEEINQFIDSKIDNNIEYKIKICGLDLCYLEEYPGNFEVYVSDRIISTILESEIYEPKRLKLFLWKK